MGKPLDFTFYNPDQLEDQDLLGGFVARQELANKILARLGEIKPRGLAQHRLLVGQRGMGKTSLLRRIALGVRDQPALAAVLLPLSFREEQYNVHNLHVFWCNCLDALGDWFEAAGLRDQAERLDREVATLNNQEDDDEGSKALYLFRAWMKGEKRRPLLLLDNLDILFAGLKDKQWSLRRVLQEAGGIVVIGASAAALEAAADREAAFYDFFQVDVLAKLEHHEILLCLRHMARQRDEAGMKVLQILDRDPARIHALYDLTGGNPRTLAMLYLVLETGGDEGVMRDLERLLDQATPLYKARVEELALQARVVFDALALAWDPATAADLAAVTGLEVGSVSTQLDRLFRDGVVEKTSLSSTSRLAYQVAERFFNIWYLMRHSPRRQRLRLRWLTEMLRQIYSPRELRERAKGLLGGAERERFSRAEYCLALGDAVDDRDLRVALRGSVRRYAWFAAEGEVQLDDDLAVAMSARGCDNVATSIIASDSVAETYRKAIEKEPADPGLRNALARVLLEVPEHHAEAEVSVRRAIELDPQFTDAWNNLGLLLRGVPDRHAEAEAAYRKALEIDPKDPWSWNNLGNLLAGFPECHAEAEAALRTAIELDPKYTTAWLNLGFLLDGLPGRATEAETAYRRAIELDPKDPRPWNNLGWLLASLPERHAEAEAAYRSAIELDSENTFPWTNLGLLLSRQPGRHTEAEAAFRRSIEIDPSLAWSWNRLGLQLVRQPERRSEAEAAYRRAIEIDPKNQWSWNDLGNLLADQPDHRDEAEAAYRTAIEIDPNFAAPWINLGNLLSFKLGYHADAEAAYRLAIEIDPKNQWSWNGLGNLLADQPGRQNEAEAAYRMAIEVDPKDARPWSNLAELLVGLPERYTEAEGACRKSIEIDPMNARTWSRLGLLLANQPEHLTEAEAAYRRAIEIDPNFAAPWNNLGNLLSYKLGHEAEAEAAYRLAIEVDPTDARPWSNLGSLLAARPERLTEAEAAYRKAIELNPQDAERWLDLGDLLGDLPERCVEAEAAYRMAIEIDPQNAETWINLGNLLGDFPEHYSESEAAYRKAIEIDPNDVSPWNNLANLLADHLFRIDEAEKAYRAAIRIDPKDCAPIVNLAYLLLEKNGSSSGAEPFYRAAIAAMPSQGVGLLRAFHALAADNFGAAVEELGAVLAEGHAELFTVFRPGLFRNLQYAADRGYGEKLLSWFETSGFGDRYWPLRVAFDAYLHGEERLMDVNPEVRSGARRLLSEMTRRPGRTSAENPQLAPRKKPRKKRQAR